jgi:hypothetical protein
MGRVIAIANQKGGVGKTTTTINLGAALAEKENYTLLIDADPQGALSIGTGLPAYDLEFTLYSILTDTRIPIAAVTHHIRPHLDLIPSNIDLAGAELQLVAMMGREYVLRQFGCLVPNVMHPEPDRQAVRLIGIGFSNLSPVEAKDQLELFTDEFSRRKKVEEAVFRLRRKLGDATLTKASLMTRKEPPTSP